MKKTKLETDLFYYGNYLELISKFSLSKQLTLSDLGTTPEDKAVIQKCYRDMKKENFDGTVIDYLCSISAQYILDICDKEANASDAYLNNNYIFDISKFSKLKKYNFIFNEKDKDAPRLMRATQLLVLFLCIACKNKIHARNILRVFYKKPSIIIISNFGKKLVDELKDYFRLSLSIFKVISVLYFVEYWRETILSGKGKPTEEAIPDEGNIVWEIIMPYALETMFVESLENHAKSLADDIDKYLSKDKEEKNQNKIINPGS